jgi:plastocyanin
VLRVVVAVGILAAGSLAWTGLVAAAGKEINATGDAGKCDKTWGPPCFTPANGTVTQVNQGETVTWKVLDGTHTVTPVDSSAFTGSGDLTGPDGTFSVTFDKPGTFAFYCKHHGSVEDNGKIHHGMWGKIEVKGADTTTTTAAPGSPPGSQPPPPAPGPDPGPAPPPGTAPRPAPPPANSPPPSSSPSGSTAQPGGSGSGGNGQTAAGTGRPWVGPPPTQAAAAPPPTRAAASGPEPTQPKNGGSKEKDNNDSGEAAGPADATAVPPDEAVLPPSPQFPTPTTAPLADAPVEQPHGDTVAVLKNEPGGKHRKLILLGTMLGVGAFAAAVGGWKFMNRPSKYWPA